MFVKSFKHVFSSLESEGATLEKRMEISKFREDYRDAQVRFRNSLQTVATVIEILEAAGNPKNVESVLSLLCAELPKVLQEYEHLDNIVEEYLTANP